MRRDVAAGYRLPATYDATVAESPGSSGERRADVETRRELALPPALLLIPRESVTRIPLMCLIPSCEWDDTSDVEHAEPAWSAPFVF